MQKQVFDSNTTPQENSTFQPKQEFEGEFELDQEMIQDLKSPLESQQLEQQMDKIIHSKSSLWKPLLKGTILLFLLATIAQSIQWLYNSFQQQQWIYFSFAVVSFILILLVISIILKEWRNLVKLKKHLQLQQQSQSFLYHSEESEIISSLSNEQAQMLCLEIVKNSHLNLQDPAIIQWQNQINEVYTGEEVLYLFSQTVLTPLDKKAKKLIAKMATESAIIISISPLAVVDMLFIAWRNLDLINKLAQLYGIELGYFARIRLLRLVLINMAFAGATEMVQDMGLDWLSQDFSAKISSRIAQGLGVGLLTARLGIKALELCRPLYFQEKNKLTLRHIQKELLSEIKTVLFNSQIKQKDKV